jgi:hypothetical protein
MMLIEKLAARTIHVNDFLAHNPGRDAMGQYGAGGVVKGPVNALLGENGPEVVVPLKKKFMNKKVKDVVAYYHKRQSRMSKLAAVVRLKKVQDKRIKAIGKKKTSYGGYDENPRDGSMFPNSSLGNKQIDSEAVGYGSMMGSLHSGGEFISSSVRGGSTPSLR